MKISFQGVVLIQQKHDCHIQFLFLIFRNFKNLFLRTLKVHSTNDVCETLYRASSFCLDLKKTIHYIHGQFCISLTESLKKKKKNFSSKTMQVQMICDVVQIVGVRVMVFNATFNTFSVISWSVLLVEEIEIPGENHKTVAID